MVSRSLTIKTVFQVLVSAGTVFVLSLGCNNTPTLCEKPTPTTDCRVACSRRATCHGCCGEKHKGFPSAISDCTDECDKHYTAAPEPCPTCPPSVCSLPDLNCNDEDETIAAIFSSAPSFMDTTLFRDAVCRLSSSERDDLLDDILDNQTWLWDVTESKFDDAMQDFSDSMDSMLEQLGLDGYQVCIDAFYFWFMMHDWEAET